MRVNIPACNTCNGNCLGCFYSDICYFYQDIPDYSVATIIVDSTEVFMSLCEGRHDIPDAIDGSIFNNSVDPLNIHELDTIATSVLSQNVKKLNLYVTGLTVALVSVLNVCRTLGISVVLYHFDRESCKYFPQSVV